MAHKPIRVLFIITGLSTGGAEMMLLKLMERIIGASRLKLSLSMATHSLLLLANKLRRK